MTRFCQMLDKIVNPSLLSNPYNWVTVFLMTAFALLLLQIVTPQTSTE